MLKTYIKTAWRSLLRTKSFSLINLAGLATGMAGAVLIILWLYHEISYDRFHEHKDRLYEVYGLAIADQKMSAINQTEQPLAPALQRDFPEVESTARLGSVNSFLISAGNRSFTNIKGNFVDPAFLQQFSFPVLEGDSKMPLSNVNEIVITETLAKKLFGNENALNKTIRIDSVDQFLVTAILKDLPSNTRFEFEYLLPWSYLKKIGWSNDSWLSNSISTFVLLKPNTNVAAFNDKIRNIAKRYTGRKDIWTHFLFPLEQWHLYAEFTNGKPTGGRIEMVRLFGIVAALILLVACINFMNLSTARSEKRAKEVGVRKVTGAGKGALITQFMTEAVITAFAAGIIALLMVQVSLPYFNKLVAAQLSIPWHSILFWVLASAFILLTGLLAGSYPALYLSSFAPVNIFKGKFKRSERVWSPRKILVVTQFTFAVMLIIATLIVRNQIRYAQERTSGYSANNLVYVDIVGDIERNYSLIKQELLSEGIASSVTKTMTPITQRGSNTWGLTWEGKRADFDETIALFSADAGLVKTAGLQLVAGRDIDVQQYPSDSFALLLNETAVRIMGFNNPVGQMIREPAASKSWRVIGVVKDYVVGSPYESIPPVVIMGPASWFNTLHIKLNAAHSTASNLKKAEGILKKYNPGYPFDYQFTDQVYAAQFKNEERTKMLAGLFATLAIFISCLGLLGMSAFMAESRMKEIGVRKVLGASVLSITRLLTVDYIRLVIISVIIATPVAWWLMNSWLQNFSYRITITWWMIGLCGLLVILIALFTVSFEVIRAAIANPVKSLRRE